MTLYYSPTGGFLDSDYNSTIADNAVQITQALHETLMQGQSASRHIIIGADGLPTLSEPDINVLKAEAIASANQGYQTAILQGFDSSALDEAHHYPSTQSDQQLLMSLVMTDSDGSLYCQNGAGNWTMLDHTSDQVRQVLKDMNKSLQLQKKAFANKITAINTATNVADVEKLNA